MSDLRLTVLGATGYTGRLCAHEAVRQGIGVRLAGRDRAALDELAAELVASAGDLAAPDVVVIDLDDAAAATSLAASADVLLTTVGPYLELGDAALEACIATGTPYLDVTGEVPFAAQVSGAGERAAATGTVLLPAVGYDGVPGELLAHVAAAEGSGAVERVRVAYRIRRGGATVGTLRSVLGVAAHGGQAVRGGALIDEPIGADVWRAPFDGGAMGAMSVPLPELVHLPRSLAARSVRTYLAVPGAAAGGTAARVMGTALRTRVRSAVRAVVDRLPEGPDADARAATTTEVVAEVVRGDGVFRARATIDDVYGTTAVVAVACARRLLDVSTRPAAGVTTPALVLGDPGAALDELGARWSLDEVG